MMALNTPHKPMKVLLTGAAGFIGMHTALKLLARGDVVAGIDNINDYYSVRLKQCRLAKLRQANNFTFTQVGVEDRPALQCVFDEFRPDRVIHLAAQAGVRYSITNPHAYAESNLMGFVNILEECKKHSVQHLVYASSSSVYGGNTVTPFSEHHGVNHPVSLYAATKKANELMAHTYSHLFGLPTTGLRFFTVYGPWGRPDMSPMLFASAIMRGEPIKVFNHGNMLRDFTYIDDIVEGLVRVLGKPATPHPGFNPAAPDPATSHAPYRIFNIGNSQPVPLLDYIQALEQALGQSTSKEFLPMQPGDVVATAANTTELEHWVAFKPQTTLQQGLEKFADWFRTYHRTL